MRACRGCGGEIRAGKHRFVLGVDGRLVRASVCSRCARRALKILVAIAPPPAAPAPLDGKELLRRVRRELHKLADIHKFAADSDWKRGREEGLDSARFLINEILAGRPIGADTDEEASDVSEARADKAS